MNRTTPIELGAEASPDPGAPGWRVRAASPADLDAIVISIGELLVELGGTPPDGDAMRDTALALLEDEDAGAILVADADGSLVGVLAASWQSAIHVPGRYALIQDLWVHASWRGRAIGGDLLAALIALAHEQGVGCVEVGLPRERFAGLPQTEAFYRGNGFAPLGARMRRTLS
jgi:GNAT superfamily N-acetyltransferase